MSSIESHLSNKPKQVFFNPINIFDTFTHSITLLYIFNTLFSFNVNFLIYRSCIQEGLGSSKHSSNRQNNRLISLQKDLLKSAVNEANRAWNGNKSKPLPLRCETAMCMFRDDVDDPTMEGEYLSEGASIA